MFKKITVFSLILTLVSCLTVNHSSSSDADSGTTNHGSIYFTEQDEGELYRGFSKNKFPTRIFETVISSDGKYIVTHYNDNTVEVYDSETMKPLWKRITGERVIINITPDDKYVTSLNQSRDDLSFWDLKSGKLAFILKQERGISNYAFTQDGRVVILAWNILYVIDIETKNILLEKKLDTRDNLYHLMVNSDKNEFIVNFGSEESFKVFSILTGEYIREIPFSISPYETEISDNGNYFVIGNSDTFQIYDYDTGNLLYEDRVKNPNGFEDFTFNNSGDHLAYCNNGLYIINWKDGSLVYKDEYAYSINYTKDNSRIFYDSSENMNVYDFTKRRRLIKNPLSWDRANDIEELDFNKVLISSPYKSESPQVIWSLDTLTKLDSFGDYDTSALETKKFKDSVIVRTDYNLYRRDLPTGKTIWSFKQPVRYSSIDIDENIVVAGGYSNGIVDIYDAVTGKRTSRIKIDDNSTMIRVSISNNTIAFSAYDQNRKTMLYIASLKGEIVRTFPLNTYYMCETKLSKDGKRAAIANARGAVMLIDTNSGDILKSYDTGNKYATNIDLNEEFIAISYSNTLATLINIKNNSIINMKGHIDEVVDVDLSMDGKYLYTSSKDSSFRVWNLDGSLHLAIYRVGPKDYIIHNSENIYATKGAIEYIIFFGEDKILTGKEVYSRFGDNNFFTSRNN